VASEYWSVRIVAGGLAGDLRAELRKYRLIMIAPTMPAPKAGSVRQPGRPGEPQPLSVPDPRLVRALDPSVGAIVAENPAVESILTREIVRDLDSKIIDVRKLLERSALRVSFGTSGDGRVRWTKVEKSSGILSIDRLAVQLVRLLEKYRLLQFVQGLDRLAAEIIVDKQIEITIEGRARPGADMDGMRGRVEAGLMIWRLLVTPEEAAALQDIQVETRKSTLRLRRTYDKDQLVGLLMRYYDPANK
jgi:hypothetical protein